MGPNSTSPLQRFSSLASDLIRAGSTSRWGPTESLMFQIRESLARTGIDTTKFSDDFFQSLVCQLKASESIAETETILTVIADNVQMDIETLRTAMTKILNLVGAPAHPTRMVNPDLNIDIEATIANGIQAALNTPVVTNFVPLWAKIATRPALWVIGRSARLAGLVLPQFVKHPLKSGARILFSPILRLLKRSHLGVISDSVLGTGQVVFAHLKCSKEVGRKNGSV